MSRYPGLIIDVSYDPERYTGEPIPEAIIEDLADWLSARHLFGGFRRITYDEGGYVIGACQDKECTIQPEPHWHGEKK